MTLYEYICTYSGRIKSRRKSHQIFYCLARADDVFIYIKTKSSTDPLSVLDFFFKILQRTVKSRIFLVSESAAKI